MHVNKRSKIHQTSTLINAKRNRQVHNYRERVQVKVDGKSSSLGLSCERL